MSTSEKATRKGNPLLGISLSILFVVLGLHLIFNVAERPETTNPVLIRTIGIIVTVFFGGLLLLVLIKLLKRK